MSNGKIFLVNIQRDTVIYAARNQHIHRPDLSWKSKLATKYYKFDTFGDIKLKSGVVFVERDAEQILNSNLKIQDGLQS